MSDQIPVYRPTLNMTAGSRRFRIWYRNPGSDFENGPWTGHGVDSEAAIEAMQKWFAECGTPAPVIVTRCEEEPTPDRHDAYDPAAHLRAMRWIEPRG